MAHDSRAAVKKQLQMRLPKQPALESQPLNLKSDSEGYVDDVSSLSEAADVVNSHIVAELGLSLRLKGRW